MGVFKKLGWEKDLTPAELATIEKAIQICSELICERGEEPFPPPNLIAMRDQQTSSCSYTKPSILLRLSLPASSGIEPYR